MKYTSRIKSSVLLIVLLGCITYVSTQMILTLQSRAANTVPLITPSTLSFTTNQTKKVQLTYAVGSRTVSVASISVIYTPSDLVIVSCIPGPGMEGIAGSSICQRHDNSIVVDVESTTLKGPGGNVVLAEIELKKINSGNASLKVDAYDIITEDGSGDPMEHSADGLSGKTTPTPTPTVTKIAAEPTIDPKTPTRVPTMTPMPTVIIHFMGIKLGTLKEGQSLTSFFQTILSWL